MNKRKYAIVTGIILILMTIIAIYAFGFVYSQFYPTTELTNLKEQITINIELYKSLITSIVVIILLDFFVSYTLFKYFEDDHKTMSFVSGIIRVIYTLIFGIATYYLTKNLNTNELTNQMANSNFEQFQTIWNSGLVVFGFHILLIGFLMKLHFKIPQILWYITLIAGISYVVVSLLKLENPNSEMVKILVMILALPMAIGELGLAIWLLIKGGKETRITKGKSS